eukprot:scaffold2968_cov111-Isochrysis_galbana.AAC.2
MQGAARAGHREPLHLASHGPLDPPAPDAVWDLQWRARCECEEWGGPKWRTSARAAASPPGGSRMRSAWTLWSSILPVLDTTPRPTKSPGLSPSGSFLTFGCMTAVLLLYCLPPTCLSSTAYRCCVRCDFSTAALTITQPYHHPPFRLGRHRIQPLWF